MIKNNNKIIKWNIIINYILNNKWIELPEYDIA
jgi:hypothetical protein